MGRGYVEGYGMGYVVGGFGQRGGVREGEG